VQDLVLSGWFAEPDVQKRPINVKRDPQKRPIYVRPNLPKRLINMKRDVQKRPVYVE